jgi:hypothetical protein
VWPKRKRTKEKGTLGLGGEEGVREGVGGRVGIEIAQYFWEKMLRGDFSVSEGCD